MAGDKERGEAPIADGIPSQPSSIPSTGETPTDNPSVKAPGFRVLGTIRIDVEEVLNNPRIDLAAEKKPSRKRSKKSQQ